MSTVKLGIGFATGRKSFKKVLTSYVNMWEMSKKNLPDDLDIELNLFVAYDTSYKGHESTDFTNLSQKVVNEFNKIVFIGEKNILHSLELLSLSGKFTDAELKAVFGNGYAGKRNLVLLSALENHMDYLIFLDDDEYPMALMDDGGICDWRGQEVLKTHIQEILDADFTHGYHCGYISPIPQMKFDNTLSEETFKKFITSISNDIINWENIKDLMSTKGITYASKDIMGKKLVTDVPYVGGCKFISGSNLCINLRDPFKILSFFNPPKARGEDTFLSTMLKDRVVKKVPCYTFHDGFATYNQLLEGALPIHLKGISAESEKVRIRFRQACFGWVRYKPLLTYIVNKENFHSTIANMRMDLEETLPSISKYFQDDKFMLILNDLDKYYRDTEKHYELFTLNQKTWNKVIKSIF